MSDSNRVQLRFIEETVFGTMPTGSPMTIIENLSSESLAQTTDAGAVDVIRDDFVKPSVTRRSVSGGGSLSLLFSAVDLDPWLEGAMREDFGAINTTTGSLSTTAPDTVTMTGAFTNMEVGDFFTIASSISNDNLWQIATKTSNDEVVVVTYADQSIVTETATAGVTIANEGSLVHGTTLKSVTVERQYQDLTDYIIRFTGQRVSGFTGTWGVGQDTTAEVSFEGKAPTLESAVGGNGTTTPGPGNPIHNGIDHIRSLARDGTDLTTCVASISLNLGSPVRPLECLGSLGPQSVGGNAFDFTGSIELFNDDSVKAWITNRYQFTSLSLSWASVDANGDGYGFFLPQLKLTAGDPQAGGSDQDISASFDFVAEANAAGQLIRITKLT